MDIKLLSQIFFNENIQPPQTCVVTGAHRRILLVSSATIRMIFRALKKKHDKITPRGPMKARFGVAHLRDALLHRSVAAVVCWDSESGH